MNRYQNRQDAGKVLATFLQEYKASPNAVVLALPRGGVPVAFEIAESLLLPLDVLIVRKLGLPGYEELAMGAIASGGVTVFNEKIVQESGLPNDIIEQVIHRESVELKRREAVYRGKRPFPELANKVVILVDDGIATGATIRAAIKAIKQFKPALLIIAVPVAAIQECEAIGRLVDKIICPRKIDNLSAVGFWYEQFDQTTDTEVHDLLAKSG